MNKAAQTLGGRRLTTKTRTEPNRERDNMKLKIEITMDNAAFFNDDETHNPLEAADILRDLADKIEENGDCSGPIFDCNGNKVGNAKVTP